ncbi:MAG: hypothetical protein IKN55_09145, partial [Oscillospiraceae bacterium]|nr:hypothetical protein [Oscillospiraceae bacterium]
YGVKYAQHSGNVSLACAAKTADGKVFVEAIDCRSVREGTAWIIAYLRSNAAAGVVIDGAAGAPILTADMQRAGQLLEIRSADCQDEVQPVGSAELRGMSKASLPIATTVVPVAAAPAVTAASPTFAMLLILSSPAVKPDLSIAVSNFSVPSNAMFPPPFGHQKAPALRMLY